MPKYLFTKILLASLLILSAVSFTIKNQEFEYFQNENIMSLQNSENSSHNNVRHLETISISDKTSLKGSGNDDPKPTQPVIPDTSKNTRVSNTQFSQSSIILYHYIPGLLSTQQYFEMRGRILSPADNQNDNRLSFAFINQKDWSRYDFNKFLKPNDTDFSFLLNLKKLPPGDYEVQASYAWEWSVSPNIRTLTANTSSLTPLQARPSASSGLGIQIVDNKLYCFWKEDNKTAIDKLTFTQGKLTKEFVLGNFVSRFEVPFKDFIAFKPGQVNVSLSSATSKTSSLSSRKSNYSASINITFNAVKHHWSKVLDQQITLDQPIPWKVQLNTNLNIVGYAHTKPMNEIVVEQPSQTFASYFISEDHSTDISNSLDVNISIQLTQEGVYIVQVRNQHDISVINKPVYVGNVYPLIPDYVDLKDEQPDIKSISDAQPLILEKQRSLILKLINQKRKQFGVQPVQIDAILNTLAQNHANDMVRKDYFDHYNYDNLGPQERATNLGIKEKVLENIEMNLDLAQAHDDISRSPFHLRNLVNPNLKLVGLGFARNSEKVFKIVEDFTGDTTFAQPLTEEKLPKIKSDLILYLLTEYPYVKTQNRKLSLALEEWLSMSIQQQDAITLIKFLQSKKFYNSVFSNNILQYTNNFIQNTIKANGLYAPQSEAVTQVGIGLRVVSESQLEVYVVYI